jgi:hypothetical protein
MTTFETYFSNDRVIRELCRARVRLADRRHEALFFHNIDASQRSAEEVPAVGWGEIPTDIFPPRKLWNRYRPHYREGQHRDINLETLVNAVRHLSKDQPNADWARRLSETVAMIRDRALYHTPFVFSAPAIVPGEKDRVNGIYRPLASFCLPDKIIDCLTARYFRETLDSALLDSCMAYRAGSDGRDEALDIIWLERQLHADTGLFVAECDIKGFFDCVSHEVARNALHDLIADAQRQILTLSIDSRALEIFEAFLSCYSFQRNIRQGAELELKRKQPEATYPWPEQQLRDFHGASSDLYGLGVPQGGALSGLIANAVLHAADKGLSNKPGLIYLRYCDDMIVLAQDRGACQEALDSYCSVMQSLKLPIHEPEPLNPYEGHQKKSFWEAKSKPVYHWAKPDVGGSFPWIQFLGYQIRYDGVVRIRPSSIAKEHKELVEVTGKVLRSLRPDNLSNIRRSPNSIKHRVRMKLISKSVGRKDIGQVLDRPLPNCWASGFRWASGKNLLTNNLKKLDRQRERQINRVSRRLKDLDIQVAEKAAVAQKVRRYYGFPYGYVGQFKRSQLTNIPQALPTNADTAEPRKPRITAAQTAIEEVN